MLNQQALLGLVKRHATPDVIGQLEQLETLDQQKRDLRARERELEQVLLYGPKPEEETCPVCHRDLPGRNGHHHFARPRVTDYAVAEPVSVS
jgi:hypothetical protein